MTTLLQILKEEVGHVARHSFDEGRENLNDLERDNVYSMSYLNDLEIEHLIKMTDDVVLKIKRQLVEESL